MSYRSIVLADAPLNAWPLNDGNNTAVDLVGPADLAYSGGILHGQAPVITDESSTWFDGTGKANGGTSIPTITGDFSFEGWGQVCPPVGYAQSNTFAMYGGAAKSRMLVAPGGYYFSVWIAGTEQVIQFFPGGDVHTFKKVYWCFQRSGTSLLLYRGIVGTDLAPVQIDNLPGVATTAVDLSPTIGQEPNSPSSWRGYLQWEVLYGKALSTTRMGAHYTSGITSPPLMLPGSVTGFPRR